MIATVVILVVLVVALGVLAAGSIVVNVRSAAINREARAGLERMAGERVSAGRNEAWLRGMVKDLSDKQSAREESAQEFAARLTLGPEPSEPEPTLDGSTFTQDDGYDWTDASVPGEVPSVMIVDDEGNAA